MWSSPPPPQFFIRYSTGLSWKHPYTPSLPLSHYLSCQSWKQQISLALHKGHMLDPKKTLHENNIKPYDIVHVVSSSDEVSGCVYVGFQGKVYHVQLFLEDSVELLQNRIERVTALPKQEQIVLVNGVKLEGGKPLKDYHIRNGDFLCMAQATPVKPIIIELPQVIYPPRTHTEKRRGSECLTTPQPTPSCDPTKSPPLNLISSCYTALAPIKPVASPSPLSSNLFKYCIDNWMREPHQGPKHPIKWAYVGDGADRDGMDFGEDDQSGGPSGDDSIIVGENGLCESEEFQEFGSSQRGKGQEKMVPKIVLSTQIESPFKKAQYQIVQSPISR